MNLSELPLFFLGYVALWLIFGLVAWGIVLGNYRSIPSPPKRRKDLLPPHVGTTVEAKYIFTRAMGTYQSHPSHFVLEK